MVSSMLMMYGYLFEDIFLVGGLVLFALTLIAVLFFPHRGFTHSILFGLIISAPLMLIHLSWAVIAFASFYSHLVLDGIFFKVI